MSTAILLPIALVQGYWLLKRTPSLPIPEGRSGRFGTQGGAAFQVVGIGDSVIAGTGVNQLCSSVTGAYARLLHERVRHDVEWCVFGRVGATTAQILADLLPGAPPADVYVVSGGVNDATRGVSPTRFADNLQRLFTRLRARSPHAAILYCGLPPFEHLPALPWPLNSILAARARSYQRHALEVVARDGNAFCFLFPPTMCPSQFASDGFHPAEPACERWAAGLLDLWPLATSIQSGTATNIEQDRKRPVVLKLPTRGASQSPARAAVATVTCTSRTRTK
jgi:lysophospholipase L1-like esterase